MAFTQIELDALEVAIAQGALTVKYGDKEVTYDSYEKLLQRRNLIRSELGLNGVNPGNRGRRYGQFSKGLE